MDTVAALAAAEPELTPVAVVDELQLERNLAGMAAISAAAGVALRPHAKTHKSTFVASRQLAHGAVGLTVATLQEAEVFAAAGVEDILIAHPPVGTEKLRRLALLADRIPRLAVAVDSVAIAEAVPVSVEILWEVDSGGHRLGTLPGPATADSVLRMVAAIGGERVRGLMTHGGHAYRVAGPSRLREAAEEEAGALLDSAQRLREQGFGCRVLSVGSTPTAAWVPRLGGITEMRPGTYAFYDANQVGLGSAREADCALAVVATVVSVHPDRAVVDAGSKALSTDLRVAGLEGHGLVLGHPELVLERLSEEHGVLVGEGVGTLQIGARLVIIPNHVCTTVNLNSELLFFGAEEPRWEPVGARGWR